MDINAKIDGLKNALLLERRAEIFYAAAAEKAENSKAREVFKNMAKEEASHARFIEAHLRELHATGNFGTALSHSEGVEHVLDAKIRVDIIAAGFESAALYAAIALEEKAIAFYAEHEDRAEDPEERQFYHWLTDWERQHLAMLEEIDKQLREEIWHDNNFWPF